MREFEPFLEEGDPTTLASYLESPKFLQASTNASRLVNKLKVAVANQELYETQQILRTVYFRFINHSEKIDALGDLLYYGAIHLMKQGEHISGQDLGSLFLETVAKRLQADLDQCPITGPNKGAVSVIFAKCEDETPDVIICRKISSIAVLLPKTDIGQTKFIAETLKLLPPKLLNRDLLHEVLAHRFYQVKDYANARYHFLYSSCANKYKVCTLLVKFHAEQGAKSEVDLFITQFILQYLCLQQPTDSPVPSTGSDQSGHQRSGSAPPSTQIVSRKSLDEIVTVVRYILLEYNGQSEHPKIWITRPYELPLLNFTYILVELLRSKKSEANAYRFLVRTYKRVWSRDPEFETYLNRIGVIYFGLPDPSKQQQQQQGNGGGGFFNNLLMSMLEGEDDDGEEEDEVGTAARRGFDLMSAYDELD